MKTSVRWLNKYLSPADVTPSEAERLLTNAGFPIESSEAVGQGDTMIDVEVTSNRGDCISHLGLAREIAAGTGRTLVYPAIPAAVMSGEDPSAARAASQPGGIRELLAVRNETPDVCRLFTARIIRGVKVGPSPAWLVECLEAVGQRSINNVVDITNFVMLEFGQPSHAFDLNKLRGASGTPKTLIIRYAHKGEPLTLLDGKKVELRDNELVVADGPQFGGAISLAGVMGGLGSEVSSETTDVLFEAATWDPVTVRRAARRLGIRTDASYRFERTVDPRTIDVAARRAVALILELGGPGARLVPGVLEEGAPRKPLSKVSMRAARCRDVVGYPVTSQQIEAALRGHEIGVSVNGEVLECAVPAHRPDLEREIDLIEEVARTLGLERVPTLEKIPVLVSEPQVSERAVREMSRTLTGLGFYETVTFSFVSPKDAEPFRVGDRSLINLCDERRKADPTLRSSVLPSLLACRRANQDGGVTEPGGVRLFEIASVFAEEGVPGSAKANAAAGADTRGVHREIRTLALLADAVPLYTGASSKAFDVKQDAVRLVRGAIESVALALGGKQAVIELVPSKSPVKGFDPSASAEVRLTARLSGESVDAPARTSVIGTLGLIAPDVQKRYDLQHPVVGAELDVNALLALFPPRSLAQTLPAFPGIERDLSLIVAETVSWASIDRLISESKLDRLVGREFVTTFRGQQIGTGKKSVTVRLAFRDPARTLRHEEVDPQIASLVAAAGQKLGATLRV